MNLSPDKLWDKCLALIRENISEQQYNAWFKRTVFRILQRGVEDGIATRTEPFRVRVS